MRTRFLLISVFSGLIILFIQEVKLYPAGQKELNLPGIPVFGQTDTLNLEISGKVMDKISKKAVSYANVFILGTHIGTVTNSDGEFIIKIPTEYRSSLLQISSIAYKSLTLSVNLLQRHNNKFFLEPEIYLIEEAEIKMSNPLKILRDVFKNVSVNYGSDPVLLTVFYRETVQNRDKFVSVSEAVFDVYKSGYGKMFDSDRIRISKARKSRYISPGDKVLFKLQGGPYNIFRLDIVKHPGEILSRTMYDKYDYSIRGIVPVNERNAYIISFEQKPFSEQQLYKGNIYIDTESRALTAMEFSLNEEGVRQASDFLIIKEPSNITVEVLSADYFVNYKYFDTKWMLNHARAEINFKCNWNRKFLRPGYIVPEPEVFKVVFEMAVTDVDTENIRKFRFREVVKPGEIFMEMVSDFEDPEFWGDYNVILPEQSIEEAVERLGSRIKVSEYE